jgi:hypothetical protein
MKSRPTSRKVHASWNQRELLCSKYVSPAAFNCTCIRRYQYDPEFEWHPFSVGKECLDGPVAAPTNHKVLAETNKARILNVYAAANTLETFHAHMRMSIFIVWGTPIAIK